MLGTKEKAIHAARHSFFEGGGQTKMSWRRPLTVWYPRYLSGSKFRTVQVYNDPTNDCGSGSDM